MPDIAGVALIVAVVSPLVWECAKSFMSKDEADYNKLLKECEELSRICREVINVVKDSNKNVHSSINEMLAVLEDHHRKIEELSAIIKH